MAKIKITGHTSGTGTITLTAPNTSTDRIVTLPDGTGTLLDENSSLPAANLTGTIASARLPTSTDLPLAGGTMTGDTAHGDNVKAKFGTGNDLEIYHDGSNSYIDETGTGNLRIRANDQVKLQKYTGENMFVGIADGAASIYHNNVQKLATTSSGVDVTGTVTANGLTLNHASSDTFSTITAPLNRDLRFDLRNNDDNDVFIFRNAAEDTLLMIDAAGHIGVGYAAVNGILDVRESWAGKWAGRFENTSTTGSGILGISAATSSTPYLLELRKNTTEVVLKIRADGKAMSQFTAAAWVSIDGTGTVGINDSYNISSITDNGVGLYTINIDTNMLNNNYSVTAMCQGSGTDSAYACLHGTMSTGSFPIRVRSGDNSVYKDADEVMLTIFGDQ